MTKSDVLKTLPGSAERVIAHARYRRQRGRRPSMSFILERNPIKALKLAQVIVRVAHNTEEKNELGTRWTSGLTFKDMDDLQFEFAVSAIIASSHSEEEVVRRLREELQYPHEISINSLIPTTSDQLEARELVRGLGGLSMANGAMVNAVADGPSGEFIFF